VRISALLIAIVGLFSLYALHACLRHRREGDPILLHFKRWPGKNGPLKPGLALRLRDTPELGGFDVRSDERRIREIPFLSVERSLWLTRGADTVLIEIEVVVTSTDEAQEALFRKATTTSMADVDHIYRWGKEIGVDVGDMNLVPRGMREEDLGALRVLDFVRNNVRVQIRGSIPVLDLARRIDFKIRAQPDVSPEGLLARAPVIVTFTPSACSVPILSSVPIHLVAHDPAGQSLEYEFESSTGKVERRGGHSDDPTTFFTNHESGTASLKVTCFSESLLFQTATTQIEVFE